MSNNSKADQHNSAPGTTPMDEQQTAETFEKIFFELRKVIVGQTRLLERLLV